MSQPLTIIVTGIFLLLTSVAVAGKPEVHSFSAVLEKPVGVKDAVYVSKSPVLGINWKCSGSRCRGKGTTSNVEEACKALETRVGSTKSFIAKDQLLGARCQVLPVPNRK